MQAKASSRLLQSSDDDASDTPCTHEILSRNAQFSSKDGLICNVGASRRITHGLLHINGGIVYEGFVEVTVLCGGEPKMVRFQIRDGYLFSVLAHVGHAS